MKSKILGMIAGFFGLAAATEEQGLFHAPEKKKKGVRGVPYYPSPEELIRLDIERKLKRGLKWFHFDEFPSILALNQKNANRKFVNQHLKINSLC
jgi:hypothetical protein